MIIYKGKRYDSYDDIPESEKTPASSGGSGGTVSLTIGTVTTLDAGASATASIVDGKLNLGIPKGEAGAAGKNGTSPTLTIGTVTSGTTASATIASGKLNLVLPKGDKGATGTAGTNGVGVKSLALTKSTEGDVTGGTWTGTDNKSNTITIS